MTAAYPIVNYLRHSQLIQSVNMTSSKQMLEEQFTLNLSNFQTILNTLVPQSNITELNHLMSVMNIMMINLNASLVNHEKNKEQILAKMDHQMDLLEKRSKTQEDKMKKLDSLDNFQNLIKNIIDIKRMLEMRKEQDLNHTDIMKIQTLIKEIGFGMNHAINGLRDKIKMNKVSNQSTTEKLQTQMEQERVLSLTMTNTRMLNQSLVNHLALEVLSGGINNTLHQLDHRVQLLEVLIRETMDSMSSKLESMNMDKHIKDLQTTPQPIQMTTPNIFSAECMKLKENQRMKEQEYQQRNMIHCVICPANNCLSYEIVTCLEMHSQIIFAIRPGCFYRTL